MKIRALLILAMSVGAMSPAKVRIANLSPEIAATVVALGPMLDGNLTATTFATFRALPRAADRRHGPFHEPAEIAAERSHPPIGRVKPIVLRSAS